MKIRNKLPNLCINLFLEVHKFNWDNFYIFKHMPITNSLLASPLKMTKRKIL